MAGELRAVLKEVFPVLHRSQLGAHGETKFSSSANGAIFFGNAASVLSSKDAKYAIDI